MQWHFSPALPKSSYTYRLQKYAEELIFYLHNPISGSQNILLQPKFRCSLTYYLVATRGGYDNVPKNDECCLLYSHRFFEIVQIELQHHDWHVDKLPTEFYLISTHDAYYLHSNLISSHTHSTYSTPRKSLLLLHQPWRLSTHLLHMLLPCSRLH